MIVSFSRGGMSRNQQGRTLWDPALLHFYYIGWLEFMVISFWLSRNIDSGITPQMRVFVFALKIFLACVDVSFFSFFFGFNVAI
jgi:hypothetical protein